MWKRLSDPHGMCRKLLILFSPNISLRVWVNKCFFFVSLSAENNNRSYHSIVFHRQNCILLLWILSFIPFSGSNTYTDNTRGNNETFCFYRIKTISNANFQSIIQVGGENQQQPAPNEMKSENSSFITVEIISFWSISYIVPQMWQTSCQNNAPSHIFIVFFRIVFHIVEQSKSN